MKSIDIGFRPSLDKHIKLENRRLLEVWQMDSAGIPVRTNNGRKMALWRGDFVNLQEAPVIIAAIESGQRIISDHTLWFCGIALKHVIDLSMSEAEAYAEAAEYPAASANLAIETLAAMIKPRLL